MWKNSQSQVITHLRYINNGGGLIPTGNGAPTYTVEFYNGVGNIVARQEYVNTARTIELYATYVNRTDLVLEDSIAQDGCLHAQVGGQDITTGGDSGYYIIWKTTDNDGTTWTTVDRHKAMGEYNIPEAGGPTINIALDEGAGKTYKAELHIRIFTLPFHCLFANASM